MRAASGPQEELQRERRRGEHDYDEPERETEPPRAAALLGQELLALDVSRVVRQRQVFDSAIGATPVFALAPIAPFPRAAPDAGAARVGG
jgi:hypothetical protein